MNVWNVAWRHYSRAGISWNVSKRYIQILDFVWQPKSPTIYSVCSKANEWCTRGIDLLASQLNEKCSVSVAEQSLQEILAFIASAAEFRVSSPREFRNVFEESQTPETKALVTQVSGIFRPVKIWIARRWHKIGNNDSHLSAIYFVYYYHVLSSFSLGSALPIVSRSIALLKFAAKL